MLNARGLCSCCELQPSAPSSIGDGRSRGGQAARDEVV